MTPKDYSIKIFGIELSTANVSKDGIKISDLDANTAKILSIFNTDGNKEVLSKQEIKNAILYFKSFDENVQDSYIDGKEAQSLLKSMLNRSSYLKKFESEGSKRYKEFVKNKDEFIKNEGEKIYDEKINDFISNIDRGRDRLSYPTEAVLNEYRWFNDSVRHCDDEHLDELKQEFERRLNDLKPHIKSDLEDEITQQKLSAKEKEFLALFLDRDSAVAKFGNEVYERKLTHLAENDKKPDFMAVLKAAILDLEDTATGSKRVRKQKEAEEKAKQAEADALLEYAKKLNIPKKNIPDDYVYEKGGISDIRINFVVNLNPELQENDIDLVNGFKNINLKENDIDFVKKLKGMNAERISNSIMFKTEDGRLFALKGISGSLSLVEIKNGSDMRTPKSAAKELGFKEIVHDGNDGTVTGEVKALFNSWQPTGEYLDPESMNIYKWDDENKVFVFVRNDSNYLVKSDNVFGYSETSTPNEAIDSRTIDDGTAQLDIQSDGKHKYRY